MVKGKKAIAMIELIFALVIMGIVLMSAPMLIHQSIKSSNVALQQEAIAAAAAQASVVMSMHWDESNVEPPSGESPILATNRPGFEFNVSSEPLGLVGVYSRNTLYGGNVLVPSAFVWDANETDFSEYDDVDDFDNESFGVTVFDSEVSTADVGDYVDVDLNISTYSNFVDDTYFSNKNITNIHTIEDVEVGVNSNIKFIKIDLTSSSGVAELNKSITLRAFSCNIGTSLPKGEEK